MLKHSLLQVVPTIYTTVSNKTIASNQYSVTEHFKPSDVMAGHNLPGVFFFYDLSPIKVCTLWQAPATWWCYLGQIAETVCRALALLVYEEASTC